METPQQNTHRVFNTDLMKRLTLMNEAARVLRNMGYHIVREELPKDSTHRPIIEITRDRMASLIPLLDHAAIAGTRVHWLTFTHRPHCVIDLMGVTITCAWSEA